MRESKDSDIKMAASTHFVEGITQDSTAFSAEGPLNNFFIGDLLFEKGKMNGA